VQQVAGESSHVRDADRRVEIAHNRERREQGKAADRDRERQPPADADAGQPQC
jgi:hypothetical protein